MTHASVSAIGDHIQRQYGDKTVLSVDDLLKSLHAEKYSVERHEIISALQSFERRGLGEFVVGRRGHPSRMRWKALPKYQSFDFAAANEPNTARPVEMLEYPLVLRSGVTAKLILPADLSDAESARVAQFVQQLPADARQLLP